ncbi:MAG: hypothetical protein EX271_03060 [Acidimicrobiales bacterium]|nr:hypothetical protein [Hyphomonadaceae bacterium]RZV43862.1 MAG: hypothetical protein EX271_03060 [Acidimicrobiales bacterium]
MTLSTKDYLIKRLSGYWKMEGFNMLAIPALMLFLTKLQISWWTVIATLAAVLLLGVGTMYWRAKLHQIQGRGQNFEPTMYLIKSLQLPSLILTLLSAGYCVLLWVKPDLSRGRPDQIAITVMAVLAVLEYINYYHRQLNYFDNKADLKRVFAGKRFQRSQMRRDLDQIARRK